MSRVERIEPPPDRNPHPAKIERDFELPRKAATTPGKAEGDEEDLPPSVKN